MIGRVAAGSEVLGGWEESSAARSHPWGAWPDTRLSLDGSSKAEEGPLETSCVCLVIEKGFSRISFSGE